MAFEQQVKSDSLVNTVFSRLASAGAYNIVAGFLLAAVSYALLLGVYRLTLHPLAKFPGPKLAALTYWYQFYHDVVISGQYLFRLEELHKVYGPVLRVNPNEIHIADPDFFTEIFHSKPTRTHRDTVYNLEYMRESLAFTTDHDVHARRRAALVNYFSAKSIRAMEHRIRDVVAAMSERLHGVMVKGEVIDMRTVYSAMALDVITEYSFGKSGSTAFMSRPEFGQFWVDLIDQQTSKNPFARHFKRTFAVIIGLPPWLTETLMPQMKDYFAWQNVLESRIKRMFERRDQLESSVDYEKQDLTILHELFADADLPPSDKTPYRLKEEAALLLGAGGETTSSTLSRTTFHILSNPEVFRKLKQELKEAFPDPKEIPTIDGVSHLQYLNAVVEEGLRMAMPVPARGARVFPDHPITYKDWTIPPGAAVSQSPYFTQTSPKLFPDPHEFKPERWLNNPGLAKYQVAFSKGRRMCIGINLAYAELRLGLAAVFRRFDLQLFETSRRDVDMAYDWFISHAVLESKGVRVKILGEAVS